MKIVRVFCFTSLETRNWLKADYNTSKLSPKMKALLSVSASVHKGGKSVAYSGESLPAFRDESLPLIPDETLPVTTVLAHFECV